MSAVSKTVGTTWTLLLDLTGRYIKTMSISRESLQRMDVTYTASATPDESQDPEWIITDAAFGIETGRIPTGGKIWARMADYEDSVEVNYD